MIPKSLGLLLLAAPLAAADRFAPIDEAVNAAIARGDCPGAVVLVVHKDEVVFRKAYGHRALQPAKVEMTVDTVFDMASLTKPVATATSVFVLAEQGKLKLSEPVATYWPAFAANQKAAVTLEHLLTHTSGLTADNALADYTDGKAAALKRVAGLKLEADPGARFKYSDVGFIVLGELIDRVGGQPVNEFAHTHIFKPLDLGDTGYLPDVKLRGRTAPTGQRDQKWLVGEVHDSRAAALGGVAGHAGLFSTADDLARFARMLLRGGELDGKRILTAESVKAMTTPVKVPGGLRSRGWDVDTSYSAPRGDRFPKGEGFGHTGFTGTSVWIDPGSRTAVIVLTNRVHISEKVQVARLRREVATAAARGVAR